MKGFDYILKSFISIYHFLSCMGGSESPWASIGTLDAWTWGAERARALAMDSVVQPLILSSGLPRGTEARLLRGSDRQLS